MLDHLKQRVAEILAVTESATLSTFGQAGIQACVFPCEPRGMLLYLLVPGTSDQLVNLEHEPIAVVTTTSWQLRGIGRLLHLHEAPDGLLLPHLPTAVGCVLVEVQPLRLQVNRNNSWGFSETIDIDPDFPYIT
jgi:hypothetical protein